MRVPALAPLIAAAGLALVWAPALAFDDAQFCVAAKQYVRAAAGDVGTWTDRYTRNDGVEIGCDHKTVHFKRLYRGPVPGEAWLNRQAAIWESAYCTRSIWRDAVANGWVVSATVAIDSGPRVWLACEPNGHGFYRLLP